MVPVLDSEVFTGHPILIGCLSRVGMMRGLATAYETGAVLGVVDVVPPHTGRSCEVQRYGGVPERFTAATARPAMDGAEFATTTILEA